MHTLNVDLADRSYPIHIGKGILSNVKLFQPHISGRRVAIITMDSVAALYLNTLRDTLKRYDITEIQLPDGESTKNIDNLSRIFDVLMEKRHDRKTTLIALGGGVIGDIAGFAAACYMRGVDFIQVPTTLLAQVDSSVGGKTAVNHPMGKNIIGAFHQPRCVVADLATLKTLPARELSAGMAEVIKYGLIADSDFYSWIIQNRQKLKDCNPECLMESVMRSCSIKASVVSVDEKESGHRAILNFGHTFGHAIEAFTGYRQWLHGEAVAVGMLIALELSCRMGAGIGKHEHQRLRELLAFFDLPVSVPHGMTVEDFVNFMRNDKKVVDGCVRFILLDKLGSACISDAVSDDMLSETLSPLCLKG